MPFHCFGLRSRLLLTIPLTLFANLSLAKPLLAQSTVPAQVPESRSEPLLPPTDSPPSLQPLPIPEPLPPLPAPNELLQPPSPAPLPSVPEEVPATFRVERFNVVGSTVFSPEELAAVTQSFTNRDITFAELLQARSAVTELYVREGYITSGAIIPLQRLQGGIVTIQVIEGSIESINVTGMQRLRPGYVRDRLAIAAQTPLNTNRLLEGLQMLQLNPLIQSISADLQAGTRPGTSVLQVQVSEANRFSTDLLADNGRSPSVGSFRRQITLNQANLLGLGDGLSAAYSNTDGSNTLDTSYTLPLNPRNGTLQLAIGASRSRVIEQPFDELDISANSRYYELTFRQPIAQTPTQEFAFGLTASRQENQTELGLENIGPFRLSPGADQQGRTRVSALRFFQEWTQRSSQHVIAARSQFSLGLDLLDSTINPNPPDSQFFAWRGQGQWVRLLAPDSLLLIRGDVQLADRALLPLEQLGLGGQQNVRGYRQDALLTDNGALLSAELRLPILRVPQWQALLQLSPFIDAGTAWNSGGTPNPDPNVLVGAGIGLVWRQGDRFSARLDWGIPLIPIENNGRTLQENGLYFSLVYTLF